MKKVLLGICVLMLAQTSFAGHHEKSEGSGKIIIGYEIIEGERLDIAAGKSSAVDIWVEYVQAHNERDLEKIDIMNADGFEGRAEVRLHSTRPPRVVLAVGEDDVARRRHQDG